MIRYNKLSGLEILSRLVWQPFSGDIKSQFSQMDSLCMDGEITIKTLLSFKVVP